MYANNNQRNTAAASSRVTKINRAVKAFLNDLRALMLVCLFLHPLILDQTS